MRNLIRKYIPQLVITLVLLLMAAGIPFHAYYDRQFQASDLTIPSEAVEAALITEEDEDSSVLLAGIGAAYSGIVAETEDVTLQAGNYVLQLVSLSENAGNYVEIYSSRVLNEDNTQGKVLVQEPLNADGELTEVSFTVTESMEDIRIRIGYGGEGTLNVSGFYLVSAQRMYSDPICLMAAIVLISAGILVWRLKGGRLAQEDKNAVLLLTAAVILVSLPLSFDSVLDGNDLYYQFNRILGIQEGLKSGQFPVKIHSTMLHGYGYGSSIFYPELFLYIPALLGCLGVSLVNCYKVLIVLIHAATAFISYRSFSGVLKSKGMGLVASLLYTLSIYRLIDLYTRAAVGEALAMVFLPLVLWGMYELFLGDSRRWYLAVLGFTGVMQSHVLSVELCVVFGVIFGLCYLGRLREKARPKHLLLAAGSTLLTNVGFLIPLLHHASYPYKVFSVESTLSWWTVTLPKLFDVILANPAERTYAEIQNSGEMPCSLGFVMLMGILAFLYCYFREEKKNSAYRSSMFALVLSAFGIYLSTNLFPWDKVQGISFLYRLATSIQLPWRFLALSSVLLCIVCAQGFWNLSKEREVRKAVCAGACVLAFLCAGIYVNRYCEEASPRYTFENQYQREQSQVDALYFINVEHSNSYRIWNRENTFVASEGVTLNECKRDEDLTAAFTYTRQESEEAAWVDVSFTYYPNYRAYTEDGKALTTGIGDQGVLRVYLPEDKSANVMVEYREPWYYQAGRLISLLSLLAVLIWIGYKGTYKQPSL